MSECSSQPTERQFRRRYRVIGAVCLLLYIASSQLSMYVGRTLPGYILAAFAGAFIFGEIVALTFLAVRIRDEFQRVLLTQSFLWASVLTMAFATIWGMVELHSHETLPHVPILVVPFLLVILTAAAKLVIFRQHKSPAE
jgi:chromate transport protein ChrA